MGEVGEVQRYMTRQVADQLGITAHAGDWWLIDDRTLVVYVFDAARRSSVEVTEDPARVADAARWWEIAVANSKAWTHKESAVA